ncbi:MAG TPA: response regulator transcription factor [Burkholderiales bacterium]|nr:response regulator transcription factor [Burkholderiales bacterium]
MSYKILIVDDSKLARMAVTKALNSLYPDWIRFEAANAEDALSVMEKSIPDIALVDFNMPGRDGLDVAAELRRVNPQMPVGVISANHQQEIINRANALGASFLPKPLTEQALGKFLDDAVLQLGKVAQ